MMRKPNRVLVVDDERVNRNLLKHMLTPLGYEVALAENGTEALRKVGEDPPDVILLDILMPELDGFQVTRKLKEQETTFSIPIVMVTALEAVEDRIKALSAGANDFLSKPVDKVELQATVAAQMQVKAYHDHMKNHQEELEAEVAKRMEQLHSAYQKIEKTALNTIIRLSRAAEYRDEDTGAHILRISAIAAAIAHQLGLGDKVAKSIRYAAPMHDIGKIGIPDHILLKPDKLLEDEWEVMKQHTTLGMRILEGATAGYEKLAGAIALTHHEKWDGTGYPRGFKGKEIPLLGRIVAIADVFDALTSKRPYKGAFSLAKSFDIIKEGQGSHFDPELVNVFFSIKDEIVAIKDKYKDEHESLRVQMTKGLNWRTLEKSDSH